MNNLWSFEPDYFEEETGNRSTSRESRASWLQARPDSSQKEDMDEQKTESTHAVTESTASRKLQLLKKQKIAGN